MYIYIYTHTSVLFGESLEVRQRAGERRAERDDAPDHMVA